MFIEFNQMPATSRVWVYQADRPFTDAEENSILEDTKTFLASWTAHSQTLQASCCVHHHQFLVLAVDEGHNAASGCSIDKSVHFVQALQSQYQVNLFDRTRQAFLLDNEIKLISLKELPQAIASGQITPTTITFNNLVNTIAQLEAQWLLPAAETWLSRYFKAKEVSV